MKDLIWELLSESKKRMKNKTFVFGFFLLLNIPAFSQTSTKDFFFLFYNVENLFDTTDDPKTSDEEFTPEGVRHWTYSRLNKKLINISKVIHSASGWEPPQLIALCEIENRLVLDRLVNDTPLNKYQFNIIQKESPDPRGIDVALLYNPDTFYPLGYKCISLKSEEGNILKSREILYVSGLIGLTDTLHIFVNHWPSRYSGLLESKSARNLAAQTLRLCIDSLTKKYPHPKIIVAGDFNDQPTDESISLFLQAEGSSETPEKHKLYNLSLPWMMEEIQTIKHQSQWMVFDQIIVSGALLEPNTRLYTKPEWANIIKFPFLLEKDEKYGGMRLNRTYYGFRYHGGFSDHLPVMLKIRTTL